jgi:hypothetical protein
MTTPNPGTSPRLDGDQGFVGGAESALFGVAVLVVGALLAFNAWAVVDTRSGAASAAREAIRVYVESDGRLDTALDAGRDAFEASTGLDGDELDFLVHGRFARCERVTITASFELPALRLPLASWGEGFTVSSSHSEIVDPYRSGLSGPAQCD